MGGTGIYINCVTLGDGISIDTIPGLINGYNSSYDSILYFNNRT